MKGEPDGPSPFGALPHDLPPGRLLDFRFFSRPADEVAADLVGKILWRRGVGGGRLVETEAYLSSGDEACHAARGLTPANSALFGPPGTLYVYISYGIHHLLNLVCGPAGEGTGVLLRALEPLGDVRRMQANRAVRGRKASPSAVSLAHLAAGPGRLGDALAVDLRLDGLPLGDASGVYLLDDGARPPVHRTLRIGVSGGAALPLRYILPMSGFLSRAPRTGEPVR
jgi:DNA-3-methyladenine glycosylase